jgi:quercetin dioxygenase-like cupin family protein
MAVIVEEPGVGDAIPLHRHRIDEVLLYDSGRAEVRADDETYVVGPCDIVMVPAGAVPAHEPQPGVVWDARTGAVEPL